HHLLKTFWNSVNGWRDRQLPDGTVIWTSPTGHTYTTYPGSRHLFPTLCKPTATLWTGEPPVVESTGDRGVMMPKRRHTRNHNTAKSIAAERRLNQNYAASVCEQGNPDESWSTWRARAPRANDPPSF
ncbi:MAG TPA: HNH endonuclease, partial [Mycobacterium sp.]|nr:HNH endonuclease [Mycobacterium sp.]